MGTRISYHLPGHAHALTFSTWHRVPVFEVSDLANQFTFLLRACCDRHECDLWAYVVMPDHIHVVIYPRAIDFSVRHLLSAIKSTFTRNHRLCLGSNYPLLRRSNGSVVLWESGGGFDRNLYSSPHIWRMINYVHANPVRKGLSTTPEQYNWSSASAYAGMEGPIRVDLCPVEVESEGVHWSAWPE